MAYDFKSLSAYDFELLVRDLLQCHLGFYLESFRSGQDRGIDLRHTRPQTGDLIVQCKHYAQTSVSGLIASLGKEAPKVEKLGPSRYIVATSLPLSPRDKARIRKIFPNHCASDSDIFGCEDLNNLLQSFPHVERNHFKLWLTSTNVISQILHGDIHNQTRILVKEIQAKARLYVQNRSFFDALEILKIHHHCIISGIPGIGKTFLAEILLLYYIERDYQPIVVRGHISEAFKLLDASRPQVFYYDDFLGQTGWEDKLGKNVNPRPTPSRRLPAS